MEQRNGRIDRTLQPEPEVRCHYFAYPDRAEDKVIDKLVEKVGVIQGELGSLGEVIMERVETALARGIEPGTLAAIEAASAPTAGVAVSKSELESQRLEQKALKKEIDEARTILQRSREVMDFREELLRDAIDVGLELAGAAPLEPLGQEVEGQRAYALPELSPSWARTLDSLRRPRRDEAEWEWRKEPPQPVVFKPLDRMGESRVHLHLEHPFVQRILGRFQAQASGRTTSQDLARVTIVPDDRRGEPRVIAIGRLSLFGPGAARLHDQIVAVAAPYREAGDGDHLVPRGTAEDKQAVVDMEDLLVRAASLPPVPPALAARLGHAADRDFAILWKHVRDEAEGRAHEAAQLLAARGEKEAEDLRTILRNQRADIGREVHNQLPLFAEIAGEAQRRARVQAESERDDMKKRLGRIAVELETEPEELRALFAVSLRRLLPVGLVYLWPVTSL